jgi:hypothetical protein
MSLFSSTAPGVRVQQRGARRAIVEALPQALVDGIDGPLTIRKAIREDRRALAAFIRHVAVGQTWYATDGSRMAYQFTRKGTRGDAVYGGLSRMPLTEAGVDPTQMYRMHGNSLTTERPADWACCVAADA